MGGRTEDAEQWLDRHTIKDLLCCTTYEVQPLKDMYVVKNR
jgi:hypothetical protein